MKPSKHQIGTPGPFEVRFDDLEEEQPTSSTCEEIPRRRYDCSSYQRCLELAAALNWESFTCRGCSGETNKSLLWRASQAIRRDSIAKALCAAPKFATLSGSFEDDATQSESSDSRHVAQGLNCIVRVSRGATTD